MSAVQVTIFDYGAGNLHSLAKALEAAGASVTTLADPVQAAVAEVLVLPGVGAFGAAAARLRPGLEPMRSAIRNGLPTIGICLGMQLLMDASDEGPGQGLGIVGGRVTRLRSRHVPQMGWNDVVDAADPVLTEARLDSVYYANGYVCRPEDSADVVAWSEHEGDRFPAAVRSRRAPHALGVQFHPEKSSRAGVRLLRVFLESVQR